MAGSAPPTPSFVAVATEALHWASLSVPVGVGLTIAVLAIPADRGGVVAEKVRTLSIPAAGFVALAALVQYFCAPPGRGDDFTVHVLPLLQLDGIQTLPTSTAAGTIGGLDFASERAIAERGYVNECVAP